MTSEEAMSLMIQGKMDKIVLTEKGIYNAADYNLDGFNEVEVVGGVSGRLATIVNDGVELASCKNYADNHVIKMYVYISDRINTLGAKYSPIFVSGQFKEYDTTYVVSKWNELPTINIGLYLVEFAPTAEMGLAPLQGVLVGGCQAFEYSQYYGYCGYSRPRTAYTARKINVKAGPLKEVYPEGFWIMHKTSEAYDFEVDKANTKLTGIHLISNADYRTSLVGKIEATTAQAYIRIKYKNKQYSYKAPAVTDYGEIGTLTETEGTGTLTMFYYSSSQTLAVDYRNGTLYVGTTARSIPSTSIVTDIDGKEYEKAVNPETPILTKPIIPPP